MVTSQKPKRKPFIVSPFRQGEKPGSRNSCTFSAQSTCKVAVIQCREILRFGKARQGKARQGKARQGKSLYSNDFLIEHASCFISEQAIFTSTAKERKAMKRTLVSLACLLFSAGAHATVVNGTIHEILDNAGARVGSTVDHWKFTVLSAGTVTIDTLSWESDEEGRVTADGIDEPVDVNGDGEIAFLDTYIYLFRDDGSLNAGDLIGLNDDSSSTYSDGSIEDLDAFLSSSLAAGDYLLAIGAFHLTTSEAIAGSNADTTYPVTCRDPSGGCFRSPTDHGDYRITFTGDLTVRNGQIPEPATLGLLGAGLLGLGFGRRHKP
jgi:hypothetical protein